jgi:hypothetical protein
MQLLISALQLPAGAISHPHTDGHADAYNHAGALQLLDLQLSDTRAACLRLHVYVGL